MSTKNFKVNDLDKYDDILNVTGPDLLQRLTDRFGVEKAHSILQHLNLVMQSQALTGFFGVEDIEFRRALRKQLQSPQTKTVIFTDILGAHAWANPLFHRYLYEQASIYVERNHGLRWNLVFNSCSSGHAIRHKIESRLVEGDIDIDEVMPDYDTGEQVDLQIVRILLWEPPDMETDVAQDLIDFHRAFNIPLFFFPREGLGPVGAKANRKLVEFHVPLDANDQVVQEGGGWWVHEQELVMDETGVEKVVPKERVPSSEYDGRLVPPYDVMYILEQRECVFALEKRRELLGEPRHRKIFFVNSPTRDTGGFKGSPTSLLYTISPLVEKIKEEIRFKQKEGLGICGFSRVNIFDPTYYNEGETLVQLKTRVKEMKPDIVGISCTSDSFHVAQAMAEQIRNVDTNTIVIMGGPHCDEVDFSISENPNNPLYKSQHVDFCIAGDGEYMLLALVSEIMNGLRDEPERVQKEKGVAEGLVEEVKARILNSVQESDAFRSVKGIARLYFKVNGKQFRVDSSGTTLDLNDLPPLRYEYLKKEHLIDFDVFKKDDEIPKCVQVITRRGCRSRCDFCSEGVLVYDRKERFYNDTKTVETVLAEIEHYIRKSGVETIFFDDSTFITDEDFVMELSEKLIESGLSNRIKWGCLNTFAATQNEALIQQMCKAGLKYMYLGLEVLDDEWLRKVKKPSQVRLVEKALEILRANKVKVGVSILFGHPEASEENEMATLERVGQWVVEGKIHLVSLSLTNHHLSSSLSEQRLEQTELNYLDLGEKIECQNKPPWNCFEEGGWYPPKGRGEDEKYLRRILWQARKCIPEKVDDIVVLVRAREIEGFYTSLWAGEEQRIFEAYDLISEMNKRREVNLSPHRIAGDYVRYDPALCQKLRGEKDKIVTGFGKDAAKRAHHLIWGSSGEGKTSFIKSIAREKQIRYYKLDLMDDDMEAFKQKLAKVLRVRKPTICLVDEVDAKLGEDWPFVVLRSGLNKVERGLPVYFVLVGSAPVENVKEFRSLLLERGYKAPDALRRVKNDLEIPPLNLGDRAVIALSNIKSAGRDQGKKIQIVESAALYYIVLNPTLDSASTIADFVYEAVQRVKEGDKLLFDHLFVDRGREEKIFLDDQNRAHYKNALSNQFLTILH